MNVAGFQLKPERLASTCVGTNELNRSVDSGHLADRYI